MKMDHYLNEIEYAVTPIISSIWHEHEELQKLTSELGPIFKKATTEYLKAQAEDKVYPIE